MTLKRISYFEFKDDPKYWELKDCDFVSVNLVVGVNATGKTRFLNVLSGILKILSSKSSSVFLSGTYDFDVQLDDELYNLKIEFSNGHVVTEELRVDGILRLSRCEDGHGKIYYTKEDKDIDFQVPLNIIAFQQRRDTLQHPYIVKLAEWAENCEFFSFSTSFSNELLSLTALQVQGLSNDPRGKNLIKSYIQAFEKFGHPFDKAILRDMKSIGYNLVDVQALDIRSIHPEINVSEPVLGICVTERQSENKKKYRDLKLSQLQMSQGMFRALSLVIHLNIVTMSKRPTLLLVDDIGEGLDYERSTSIIKLLIKHSGKSIYQVIMTSNDRFVMNSVPLKYWTIFVRTIGAIKAFTARSHPKEFKDFEYMGLSNFDFFKSNKLH
jgi:predicted ATP-dependent endonuclease of OLD family